MRPVYAAAECFVQSALRNDDSLFTPGASIWAVPVLLDLRSRFTDKPDVSKDGFEVKLKRQLAGAPPTTIQLAGELLFVHFLASGRVTYDTKKSMIERVLSWSSAPVAIPENLFDAMRDGIAHAGMAFNTRRPWLLFYLIEFVVQWKGLSDSRRELLLRDPYAFKQFAFEVPGNGAQTQQHALLHLVHPEAFEPYTSQYRKRDIVAALGVEIADLPEDVDRGLALVREKLTPTHGPSFQFYDPGIRELWLHEEDDHDEFGTEPVNEEGASETDDGADLSEAEVRAALEALLPESTTRGAVLAAMVESLRAAHAVNAKSWVITLPYRGKGGLRMLVGKTWCLALTSREVVVTYQAEAIPEDNLSAITSLQPERFSALPLSYVRLNPANFERWWPTLREANLEAARVAAARARRSAFGRHHCAAAVEYLRQATSMEVPDSQAGDGRRSRTTSNTNSQATLDRGMRVHDGPAFRAQAFELLSELHGNPTKQHVRDHREALDAEVARPFRGLFHAVIQRLPDVGKELLETETRLFGRFAKNDWGQGGAWDFYWGALYPKDGSRINDLQLFVRIDHDHLSYGFDFGSHSGEAVRRFAQRCRERAGALEEVLRPRLEGRDLVFGPRIPVEGGRRAQRAIEEAPSLATWLGNPEASEPAVRGMLLPREVTSLSAEEVADRIAGAFEALYPLVLLALADDFDSALEVYLGDDELEEELRERYSLESMAEDSGIDLHVLSSWVAAIERKGQAILYGPPGTGKTHLARLLARHLAGGGDGVVDMVQFHPAYAYEDFVQGIRPRVGVGESMTFEVVRGRFLEFCHAARERRGRSVLIVDEINRANLARVLGELMFLLEYRGESVPLAAGGRLQIPGNVRILGTMNTADRSIALVDHALRRRFAFLALRPDYEVLRRYHARTNPAFPVDALVAVLTDLNRAIGDAHYEVGITFFLTPNLELQLEHIWRMEIEPYLEEYFFDQGAKVSTFRWDRVRERLRV